MLLKSSTVGQPGTEIENEKVAFSSIESPDRLSEPLLASVGDNPVSQASRYPFH
jgi:hypothetical protein